MKKSIYKMNSKASRIFRQASFMGAITAITWLPAVHADDIEALVSAPKEANILFVLDVSGSMGWDVPGGGNQGDRLDQMKAAITTIIDSQTTNPNIGFTYFGGSSGSGIKWPISPLDGEAHNLDPDIPRGTSNGQVIKYMANALSARGSTPSTDAMYEATLYFR
ncbi:MAG TPA: VWA domain-containing protein, partial [Gammaproteobacteria bacterium]|nr:VWA domain-containing protein [Gammaproteobacteria bacterium]